MNSEEQQQINTPIQDLVRGTQQNGTIGPMIGSIIIIILIIGGGLYFFGSIISSKKDEIKTEELQTQQENALFQVGVGATSTEDSQENATTTE